VFEFDPIPMMFACLYLAAKTSEIHFVSDLLDNIHAFVKAIGEEKFCNVESKIMTKDNMNG
jgi:hypothetical protein